MLDFINCKELQDKSRLHSTMLDVSGNYAITKSPQAFEAGQQVFENYGQANSVYFQYHGFSLGPEDGGSIFFVNV